jgi:hypothetical protein
MDQGHGERLAVCVRAQTPGAPGVIRPVDAQFVRPADDGPYAVGQHARPMNRRSSILISAVVAGALAVPAAASAAPALQIGRDGVADGAYTNVNLANPGDDDLSGTLTLKSGRHVVAKGKIALEGHEEDALPMLGHTKWGADRLNARGAVRTSAVASVRVGGRKVTVHGHVTDRAQGARGFDGRYKATNGLSFYVKNGFVYGLDQQTMAYCTSSATNEVAFLSDPYDRIAPYVHPNGSFAVTGHSGIGQIVTFKGKLKRHGRSKGYASYSLSRFSVGYDGGYDTDYCATGGKWTAKRISKKVPK